MRLQNRLKFLGLLLSPLWANAALAGAIYISNPGTDSISVTGSSGGVASTLINLPVGADPHQIVINANNYLFVANDSGLGTVGEYTTFGTTVNSSLISGLSADVGLAVSGSDLFVANYLSNTIGEYVINSNGTLASSTATLITLPGASGPFSLAVSGSDLYVAASKSGEIYGYTTSGGVLGGFTTISDSNTPEGLVVSGSELYVSNASNNTIGQYDALLGATGVKNTSFISTGLNSPSYLAVDGSDLLVANHGTTTVGEYSLVDGSTVNASFITGLSGPYGVAYSLSATAPAAPVPLPNSAASMAVMLGMIGMVGYWRANKRQLTPTA